MVKIANFTLVKKYGKGKEYTNCPVYGEKVEVVKEFEKGDLIHVFVDSLQKSRHKKISI